MLKKNFNNLIECNGKYYETFDSTKRNKIIEPFTSLLGAIGIKGGNTINVKDSKNITKKVQLDTNIDRSTVVDSCNKIINNAANEVAQSNSADVTSSTGASNSILLMDMHCPNLIVGDIIMNSSATNNTNATIRQQTQSKISNSMETAISKNITSSLPTNENEIMNYRFSKIIIAEPPNKQYHLICKLSLWKNCNNFILEKPVAENTEKAKFLVSILNTNNICHPPNVIEAYPVIKPKI